MVDSSDKHQQILNAAELIFGRHGYAQAKMDAIAEEAGVAKGTIYLYFKNKQELFSSLVEDRVRQYLEILRKWLAEASTPKDILRAITFTRVDFYLRHQGFMHSVWQTMSTTDIDWQQRMISGQMEIMDVIASNLTRVVNGNPKFSAQAAAEALVGAINFMVASRILDGRLVDPETISAEITEMFLPGFVG